MESPSAAKKIKSDYNTKTIKILYLDDRKGFWNHKITSNGTLRLDEDENHHISRTGKSSRGADRTGCKSNEGKIGVDGNLNETAK